ncbi:hypothetical protein WJX74_002920 [Apatococcus lobatus]|uniref:Peptidase S8/S53 domain-containing protein n=1 Tax=Apatococcus lobatus TaxID=904363 RepID=A0AAW1R0A6_9CHLO
MLLVTFAILTRFVAAGNDTVIIKYKSPGLSVNGSTDSDTVFPPPPPGVHLVADLPYLGYQLFALDDPAESASDFCDALEQEDDAVQFCEPDSEVSLIQEQAAPDDPLYAQQYNIPAIDLPALWAAGVLGSTNVSVCVPDTGTSPDHPDLHHSIEQGTSFVGGSQSDDYTDGQGHGTFVTGVIGAVTDNRIGIAGIVRRPAVLPCRFMDASGNGPLSSAALCFNWCLQRQAAVISCSFGATTFSAALQTAAQAISAQNVVLVTSSGNEGTSNDASPHYPSEFSKSLPGVISVAASDRSGNLWARSNYGPASVQVAAPGVSILGLGLGAEYVTLSGTSMAAPQVAGIAALLLADLATRASSLTKTPQINEAVKAAILGTTRNFSSAADRAKVLSGGVVDAGAALRAFRRSATYATASRSSISATVVAAVAGIVVGILLSVVGFGLVVWVRRLRQIRAVRRQQALDT